MKIAVIGGGVSGLSIANCLNGRSSCEVKVFEKESRPGGLIKCDRVRGNLYHMVGGHVFNSQREDVLDWFWGFFDKKNEFVKASRNATISMADGRLVGYPIENHAYQMDGITMREIINDMLLLSSKNNLEAKNFEEFLRNRFGDTLYKLYFKPYNEKIWKKDLKKIPLSWLEGKLPMPTVEEIIFNNFNHAKEIKTVHSTFYYAKDNGSQFLADRLSEGLDIIYDSEIAKIEKIGEHWSINGFICDKLIFCGNIKDFPTIIASEIDLSAYVGPIADLEYHGTTSVLCEIESNPYSWVYLPSLDYLPHRIICTGNFAKSNNAEKKLTATIEFTDHISKKVIDQNLAKIPFNPRYITHRYTKYTYPIQSVTTRKMLCKLKTEIEPYGIYLLGRFAEWEYYNMDTAMGAAIDLSNLLVF